MKLSVTIWLQFLLSTGQTWVPLYAEGLRVAQRQKKVVQKHLKRLLKIRSDLLFGKTYCLIVVQIKMGQYAPLKTKCKTWVTQTHLLDHKAFRPKKKCDAICCTITIDQVIQHINTSLTIFCPPQRFAIWETTCSEADRHSAGSLLCLGQHCAFQKWTLWKRSANNEL